MAGKSKAEIEARLLEVQLQSAELDLEEKAESTATRIATRLQRQRMMQERQENLRIGADSERALHARCQHLQGGPPSDPYESGDERQSALTVTRMPDGWTKLIYCGICHMKAFTPHLRFGQEAPFRKGAKMPAGIVLDRDETPREARMRVEKYNADTEVFEGLLRKAKKKLSDEAKQEGDSGTTHTNRLQKTGDQVFKWRSCDAWPQVQPEELEQQKAA